MLMNFMYIWIISNPLVLFQKNFILPVFSYSEIVFIFFSSFIFLIAMFIIFSKDSIYCLLGLISLYMLSAILLLAYKLEFLSFSLIIVSLGAVAVLFLYIVLMVNLKGSRVRESMFYRFNISSFLLGLFPMIILLYLSRKDIELFYILDGIYKEKFEYVNVYDLAVAFLNTPLKLYGIILYDKFFIFFILIGVLLLAALIGCILLTYEYIFDKED